MSRMVHYTGVATPVNLGNFSSYEDYAKDQVKRNGKEKEEWESNYIESLCDAYPDDYFYYAATGVLYSITKEDKDLTDDIIEAKKNKDGSISYELRYYNEVAGFSECMEEAFLEMS